MPILKQEIDSIAFFAGKIHDTILKQAIKISYLNNLSLLLRREYDKTKSFRSSAIYTLKCVDLNKVNSTDCCSTDLGCKILKTSIKIPRPIIVKDVPDFNYVGGIDLNNERRIDYILPSEIEWFKYRKLTSKIPYFTYMNDYIYVFNILSLKKIKVRYTPANPIELFELDCSPSCFDTEEDIIIDNDMAALVRPLIYQELGLVAKRDNPEVNVT